MSNFLPVQLPQSDTDTTYNTPVPVVNQAQNNTPGALPRRRWRYCTARKARRGNAQITTQTPRSWALCTVANG